MYLCILYHVLNAIYNICIIYFTWMKIKFVLQCLLMQTDLCIFNELYYEQIANGLFLFKRYSTRQKNSTKRVFIPRGVCTKTNII